jgi:hypothetical protein
MSSKEIVVVNDENREILHFLRKLVAAGSVSIELDSERFHLTIRREKISKEDRQKLLQAPMVDD